MTETYIGSKHNITESGVKQIWLTVLDPTQSTANSTKSKQSIRSIPQYLRLIMITTIIVKCF